jgi:hypothetical protein
VNRITAHARHFFDQLPGELRTGNCAHRTGEIVQFHQLVAHGIGNLDPAIANIDRPHTA